MKTASKVLYNGYTITTPSGIGESGETYYVWRIHKANPLTSLESNEHFDDPDLALKDAMGFVDQELGEQA